MSLAVALVTFAWVNLFSFAVAVFCTYDAISYVPLGRPGDTVKLPVLELVRVIDPVYTSLSVSDRASTQSAAFV